MSIKINDKIVKLNLKELNVFDQNPKLHSNEQIDKIIKSIQTYGFTNPLIVDENNMILAGHGRYEASQKLNLEQVPCIKLTNLTETQKKAYVIADNKLSEGQEYNEIYLNDLILDIMKQDNNLVDILNIDTDEHMLLSSMNDLLESPELTPDLQINSNENTEYIDNIQQENMPILQTLKIKILPNDIQKVKSILTDLKLDYLEWN